MDLHTLYLECYSGISGDMLVGALLDLGASFEHLKEELGRLPLDGYELEFGYEEKCGIRAGAFRVKLAGEEDRHTESHHADNHHADSHHEHSHAHRHYSEIRAMLEASGLCRAVKETSLRIFRVLAEAEGKVHGRKTEEVAFHEVGAVDSIVDIVGAAVCLDDLKINKILVSPMYEGQGHTWCQHGKIPVPVPAVLELTGKYSLPLKITEVQGEMITPTGAAVVAALADLKEVPGDYQIEKAGIGCGEKDFPHANILRAMLMRPLKDVAEPDAKEQVWVLETNVDDCTGEQIGYAIGRLLDAGAKDACALPLFMKKHRPAYLLQVICEEEQVQGMEAIIFRETTSIGLRRYQTERSILKRTMEELDTPYGRVTVKCCTHGDARYYYPEYECLKAIAQDKGLPYQQVYREVCKIIEAQ